MATQTLHDATESFEVTVLDAKVPTRVVLFAVGRGGNPERHLALLTALAEHRCCVVAPHFDRIVATCPTDADLLLRARRLVLALDAVARPGVPILGVGHSIGATMLLALAGGRPWTYGAKEPLCIDPDARLERLALMAPAMDLFHASDSLESVRTPVLAWAGTQDLYTSVAQLERLRDALDNAVPLEIRVVEGAGHFSFMNIPPPGTTEPLRDRDAFLAQLAAELGDFVDRPG